jgi:hypothetical protein
VDPPPEASETPENLAPGKIFLFVFLLADLEDLPGPPPVPSVSPQEAERTEPGRSYTVAEAKTGKWLFR